MAAGTVLLIAGPVTGYRELALLGGAAVAAVVLAMVLAGRPVRLEIRRSLPVGRVACGEQINVYVEVAGPPVRRAVLVADRVGAPGAAAVRRALPPLRRGVGEVGYVIETGRRGVVDIGPLEAGRVDPLGLAAAIRRYGGTDRAWVHPRIHPLRKVPGGAVRDLEGRREAAHTGGLTFHGLREHQPGDDLRMVHWRSSARHDRLMVRENVDTSRPRIVVLVDERAAGPEELDEVASAAASVLAASHRAGLGCELRLSGGRRADTRSGPAPPFDLLAEMTPANGDGAAQGLARALQLLRLRQAGDVVVLLTAAADQDDLTHFGRLRDHYQELVAGVLGEPAGPPVPGLRLLTGANAAELAARWDEVREWR